MCQTGAAGAFDTGPENRSKQRDKALLGDEAQSTISSLFIHDMLIKYNI